MKNRAIEQTTKQNINLKAKIPQPPGNNRASFTWEQSCQPLLGTILPVSLAKNCASLTWEQLCHDKSSSISNKPPVE